MAGEVVVQSLNHKVTRVLEEKVEDMPAMAAIECIGVIGLAEEAGELTDDGCDMSISCILPYWNEVKNANRH